ncbi:MULTISPECIES: MarR family winged helix-turn-helix transcriptional regulator [unclassified Methylobacterium]|jgi:DNA-binding MarR family transcriptional regulator|uniref:MarR family winged helix-turn-helix transcriptional regulator n=1 Tax=unclassified Methylobacterium TaxID=2615210 RepID=UPI0006FA943F|nr:MULTISPECIES: MarR family winged helix-turn-helix transcriptional regulator [unclassified Methylobacterium]KQO43144.1 MarR family transcriptional regulator [Methylobacterium sp. Leaf85]TXN28686.1 winged helix-turn-helix transcriptional regulator [Methylobacterium sp. WL19]
MDRPAPVSPCHCLALRQASRRLTQHYDQHLAPTGLRTSQYGLLRGLGRVGPISINGFADIMVMDRTTMGRALHPLTRDGLIAAGPGRDGRTRSLTLTEAGQKRVEEARPFWERAQRTFEERYGAVPADDLRRAAERLALSV